MDSVNSHPRSKDRSQKESHSEIERKRRERMKLETEFLHRQVPHAQCKDKLSIFLAGADRLIYYTEKLGKREFIINDEEYSRIITNNFPGFSIHIRCVDGEIVSIHENVDKILDIPKDDLIGKTLFDITEPSPNTKTIIHDSLMLYPSELPHAKTGDLIPRNFVIGVKCGSKIPANHCIRGSDGQVYRFVEFCGDLVYQSCPQGSEPVILFRGLCRPLDPACPTIATNDSSADASSDIDHVTLRLSSTDFLITEVVGSVWPLLGYHANELLGKRVEDLVVQTDRCKIERAIQDAIKTGSISVEINWNQMDHIRLEAQFNAIRLNTCLYCMVCKLSPADRKFPLRPSTNGLTYGPCVSQRDNSAQLTRSDQGQFKSPSLAPSCGLIVPKSECLSPSDRTSDLDNHPAHHNHLDDFTSLQLNPTSMDSALIADGNGPSEIFQPLDSTPMDCGPSYQLPTAPPPVPSSSSDMQDSSDDWRYLPNNTSFSHMLSGNKLPDELFHPDYLIDLVNEDVTDL